MDLKEQVDQLRQQIESSFDKRLKKLGLTESKGNIRDKDKLPEGRVEERERAESLIDIFKKEEGSYKQARKKYIEEFSFTLFNRIAALKVMGLKDLIPEPITRRHQHGNRSFAHDIWLENNPEYRSESREGIRDFLRDQFEEQAENIRLFSSDYPYDGLPEESDLLTIIEEFNETDKEQWKSDDIMGWLYEYYNSSRKQELKDSDEDIEWDKVSLSSQIYTPRWVVEFLLNNSLGKLWMEMHPNSQLADNHLIANVPHQATRKEKSVKEIKLIDPACGSGNFLLYAYELFKEMYREEGGIPEEEIPQAILENNIHGIDIDHRSVQIAQLSLYIKVMEDTGEGYSGEMNVISTDFHLPDYDQAKNYFTELGLSTSMHEIVKDVWEDLKNARKFGSLIRVEEKLEEYKQEDAVIDRLGLFGDGFSEVVEKLHKAVSSYSTDDGFQTNFLKTQSDQGLHFLEILFNEYDIASANPPYTDSGNYGEELGKFVKENYKRKKDMAQNLYTAFFDKSSELINSHGKISMIHPLTFMYIKSYEPMRKWILESFHIDSLIEFGLGGVFLSTKVNVDVAGYVVEKGSAFENDSFFMNLQPYKNHSDKNEKFAHAYNNFVKGIEDKHNYTLVQDEFKIIDGWPFIYWISDDFRANFKKDNLTSVATTQRGAETGKNIRFLKYWWEVHDSHPSSSIFVEGKKWPIYAKGGPWKKWFGNLWLIVDWSNQGSNFNSLNSPDYFFKEGITYSAASSKGITFRYLPKNCVYDVGGTSVFPKKNIDLFYLLGFLNSKLATYITNCLNPTVNAQMRDLKRVPFVMPNSVDKKLISTLCEENVKIKKDLSTYDVIERFYTTSPLEFGSYDSIRANLLHYFKYVNRSFADILIHEAVINATVFDTYDLTEEDREDVLNKQGKPSGQFLISDSAREKFLDENGNMNQVQKFVKNLSPLEINEQGLKEKKSKLLKTYQNIGTDTEAVRELSEKFEINPLTICEWIEESDVLPEKKVNVNVQKYILILAREVLIEDKDGIVPLVDFSGEITLQERIEQNLIEEKNFTRRDINELEDFLGCDLENYTQEQFFKDQSNMLNMFKRQPKTPFIWHLSSGEVSGFEVATIIYKLNRDRLISIKNRYLEKRREAVQRKLAKLGDPIKKDSSENQQEQDEKDESPEAQKKREKYRAQLEEIEEFEEKVIDLLESGYDPVLDDGVGYNIAPLQKRDMLKYDPLTSSQLDKFLNADWGSRAEDDTDA